MKKSVCPFCKRSDYFIFSAMPRYKLAKCKACDLVWDPTPPSLPEKQYQENYFVNDNSKGGYANYFEGMKINRKTFSQRLKKIIKATGNKGKLLDVGCALGDCLLEAKSLGWIEAEGIDPSEYAVKKARQRGLKANLGTLNNLIIKENSFDLVLSQDEIEHVPDPIEELGRIKKVLRPGGVLFLVTPDIGGIWAKILGKYWYHYKPGEHLVYFSAQTLKKSLEKAGFKKIKIQKTYHIMSIEYILNRFRYYSPFLFNNLLKIVSLTPLKNIPLRIYAGEVDAWAEKPTN